MCSRTTKMETQCTLLVHVKEPPGVIEEIRLVPWFPPGEKERGCN